MGYKYTVNLLISADIRIEEEDVERADVKAVDWFTESSFKDYKTVGYEVLRQLSKPRETQVIQRFGMGGA